MNVANLVKIYEQLQSERASIVAIWELIERFVCPMKGRFYQRDEEGSINWKNRERKTSEAVLSAQLLASSLHSAIVNPAFKWFSFRFRNDELNDNLAAKEWLRVAEDTVYHALLDSNFNLAVIEMLNDDVTFGTSLMSHLMVDDKFVFNALDLKGTYFTTDVFGSLDGLYYIKEFTARQLAQEFPRTTPDSILQVAKNPSTSEQKYEVLYAIVKDPFIKNPVRHRAVRPERRQFKEYIILIEGKVQLNETARGYYEMPVYLLRWGRTAGSKFGYSPAMVALADILEFNQLLWLSSCAWGKNIDPPLIKLFNGVIGNIDLRSGGQTEVRDPNAVRPLVQGINHQVNFEVMNYFASNIRRAFYVDQLQLKDSPAMTATEVQVRYELMQRLIGPPVARIKTDFLDPMLDRAFYMLLRDGRIQPPPEEVGGEAYEIEYRGAWSRAQRMDNVAVIEGAIASLAQVASFYPPIMDKVDIDAIAQEILLERGLPAKFIRDDDTVQQIRQQRAQQEQMQQQVEMLKEGSVAIKNISDAGMGNAGQA